MTDKEYFRRQFEADCREKKRIAHGENNRVKSNRGKMKTASDYMTAKERKALNGEMVTISMNKPVKWEVFQTWSEQSQKEYIENLRNTYKVPFTSLAKMFGTSLDEFTQWRKDIGIVGEKGGKKWDKEGWKQFCGVQEEKVVELPIQEKKISFNPQKSDISGEIIEAVIRTLMSTAKGAKITIEIEV